MNARRDARESVANVAGSIDDQDAGLLLVITARSTLEVAAHERAWREEDGLVEAAQPSFELRRFVDLERRVRIERRPHVEVFLEHRGHRRRAVADEDDACALRLDALG